MFPDENETNALRAQLERRASIKSQNSSKDALLADSGSKSEVDETLEVLPERHSDNLPGLNKFITPNKKQAPEVQGGLSVNEETNLSKFLAALKKTVNIFGRKFTKWSNAFQQETISGRKAGIENAFENQAPQGETVRRRSILKNFFSKTARNKNINSIDHSDVDDDYISSKSKY